MSEAPDQLAGAEAPVAEAPAGVEAAAPATTQDDIDTESFDRMDAPDEPDAEAGDGQPAEGETPDTPPAGAEDAELIDVEAAGQTFKVPAALKPFLLMQEDYTKKTQAVADRGRELDTRAEELSAREAQQAESLQALRNEHLTVTSYETGIAQIDKQLADYAAITPDQWANLRTQEPERYETLRANRTLLRETRGDYEDALKAAKTDLETKEAKLTEDQKAARDGALSKAWRETNATLSKKIEGWSPAKGQELADKVFAPLGVTPEEMREATDSRLWIMADENVRLREENARLKTASKQTTATDAALKSQTVTPAVKPAGSGAKPSGVRDELSIEEWTRRRNAQVARKAAAR